MVNIPTSVQASVGKTSKHCRACDRCVEGFDHHCKWLNNCVGAKNYKSFFSLVCMALALLTLQCAWALWLFVRSFKDEDELKLLMKDRYPTSISYVGWQVRQQALCKGWGGQQQGYFDFQTLLASRAHQPC